MMTADELGKRIVALAGEPHDYSTICDGCVEIMLEARRTFTDAAGYGISGAQAAMIGQEVSRRLS